MSKGTSKGANERILGRPSGDLECKIDQSLLQKLTQNERICGVCKIYRVFHAKQYKKKQHNSASKSATIITTRANTGHAVLQSTLKPPKMKRHNGPANEWMDRWKDGWTDRRTDPLIEVLCSTE